MADALDLGSSAARRGGSSPPSRNSAQSLTDRGLEIICGKVGEERASVISPQLDAVLLRRRGGNLCEHESFRLEQRSLRFQLL